MTNIAFCGPNLELNESLARVARDLSSARQVVLLPHPTGRIAVESGRTEFNDHDIDWLNLWSSIMRRIDLEGKRHSEVVVSGSCGLDEVCSQAVWLGEQIEKHQTGLSLVDAKGDPLMDEQGMWVNRSGAVLQTIINSTEEEIHDMWDFVYASIPDGEADTSLLVQYRDFIATVPTLQGVVKLPYGLDIATSVLEIEAERWSKTDKDK